MEAYQAMKQHLSKDGILMINSPGYINLLDSQYLLDILHTLKQVFAYVHLLSAQSPLSGSYSTNYVVIASDMIDSIDNEMSYSIENTMIYYDKDIDALLEAYDYSSF